MEDAGALTKCANTAGCDITQRLIDDLNYSNFTFQSSPAYLQYNGRPVVFFFGVDAYALDWDRVRANVNGNPLFIFRNNSGFTHKQTDGAFSWIQPNASNPDDEGLTYLDSFYTAAKNYPGEQTFGSTYSGFNNSLAPWLGSTAPKIMNQHCGQTWLDSFARIGQKYSSSSQLASIQLVTWNDYEEGTELESGIDNCVTVTGAVSGSNFTWSNTGQENTIDHYTVFISEDGEQLMSLGDVPAGTHSKSLSGLGLDPSKTYTLYVKAVGKPTLHNQISAAVTYAVANQPPTAVLSVSPASGTAPLTVTASTANSTDSDGSIVSSSINFGDGTIVAGPSASHIYNNPGTYTVTATVTDNANASSTATSAVTVSSTCKINSTDRTITICAPTNNQTVPSPVRVLAYATDSRSVSNMKIYIDGATVYTKGSTKKVDTYINVAKGIRKLKVSATDSSGTFAKTYTITVP
jgi:PKD repeat protein